MITSTARLQLEKLVLADASFIFKLVNEPGWLKFIGDRGVKTLKDAEGYIINGPQKSYQEQGYGLYKVSLADQTPIGLCGLLKRDNLEHPDIGFASLAEFTGKGYAVEAAEATMKYAKEVLNINTILGITRSENEKSIRLLEKLGMHFERMIQMHDDETPIKLFST